MSFSFKKAGLQRGSQWKLRVNGWAWRSAQNGDACSGRAARFPRRLSNTCVGRLAIWNLMASGPGSRSRVRAPYRKCVVLYIQTPLPSTLVVECRDLLFNHSSIQRTSVVYGTSESAKFLSHVRLFAIPWTVPYQVSPSLGFSRQFQYWCGLPFPSPVDLPDPGIEPRSPAFTV